MFNSTLKKLQSNYATITNETFHRQIWQDKLTEAFKQEQRFTTLKNYLNEIVTAATALVSAFNPSEKLSLDEYALFKDNISTLAEAEFFLSVIESETCSVEMFNNVETAVKLYFKVKYSDLLKTYVDEKL